MYTDRKVYRRLADKFGNGSPRSGHAARYSLSGDFEGIAAQRAAHFSIYSDDPAIAKIAGIPDEAWDPSCPEVGAQHGITWITMADLHHGAEGNESIAAIVHVDDVVFLSISLSATTKHIVRHDSEDLNGVTVLIMSLINHFPTLREMCWADDVTRAGRDRADWTQITTKCKHRDITMVFGGQRYDQRNPGDEITLGALGLVGGNDDPTRRRKLTGKRLMKYKVGGAAIAERQMPHGWHHKKDKHGRAINEGERGLIPEADPPMIPVFAGLYGAHAAGESYQRIAARMIAFESEGLLHRRDHTDLDNTYARAADDPLALYDAAKSFFVRSSFRPRALPSELAIARYLAGEDPAEVFDADTRLYIAKVELVRTGRYFRRLRNDIRGRNIVLDGIPATYRDDHDEYGWFDVLAAPWEWPLDNAGQPVPRFGLTDEACRKVAARLLTELRAPKQATGGQAHRSSTRRALQGFPNWTSEPNQPGSKYADEPTEWGVEARNNLSGRANFILLFRQSSVSAGGRGWSYFGPGEKKPDHIAATGSLTELAASVANRLDAAVRQVASPGMIATLGERPAETSEQVSDPSAAWKHKINLKRDELAVLEIEVKGHRTMAALSAGGGDETEARAYAAQAAEVGAKMREVETAIQRLEEKIEAAHKQQGDAEARQDSADVSIAAYVVAGLEAASRNNGDAPSLFGRLCDDTFIDWRFAPSGDDLTWNCTALLPLTAGGRACLPLTGIIRNLRTRQGRSLASTETVVRYFMHEGRDLDDVAALMQSTRKTLLTKRLMPWLVSSGVTARGAKCALVDHPVPSVRQELYTALDRDRATEADEIQSDYQRLLRATYLAPDLSWGDAAVPDDTVRIAAALRLLTIDTQTRKHGLPVLDVALALGLTESDVRELVKPQKRVAGFTRPKYLTYADKAKTKVKAIGCPHGRCQGRRFADHVVLLPEVSASGYGVICRHCRRAPSLNGSWPTIQFPTIYLSSWTNRGRTGSLRVESQTIPADAHRHL